jgi:nucleoside 2-deoxyribosyltransferase
VVIRSPIVAPIVDLDAPYVRFDSDVEGSSDSSIQAATFKRLITSDFVYVVAPDGYIGRATCLELGYVLALGVPTFYSELPGDVPVPVSPEAVVSIEDLVSQVLDPQSHLHDVLNRRKIVQVETPVEGGSSA